MSSRGCVLASAALVSLAIGCSAEAAPVANPTSPAVTKPYSLGATSRCLRRQGARVGRVAPADARLRAVRDLAQRTSIQAKVAGGGGVVALAFTKTAADGRLLLDLLRVANDPYRLVRRHNVVLMYRPKAQRTFALALRCLRR